MPNLYVQMREGNAYRILGLLLQSMERRNSFSFWKSVIFASVNNELRYTPFVYKSRRAVLQGYFFGSLIPWPIASRWSVIKFLEMACQTDSPPQAFSNYGTLSVSISGEGELGTYEERNINAVLVV